MNNYTITEDSLYYKKPIYKKFKNFEDCKKWINNNLDNTKNYKVFNGLFLVTLISVIKDAVFAASPDISVSVL